MEKRRKLKNMTLNFGPQHPAAHGVLRLVIESVGETIKKVDSHIGLLHRGSEKLIENKTYLQGLPYLDRLDYVSMMTYEYGYTCVIEALRNKKMGIIVVFLRMLFCEITRILNHLLALTTHALDVGALTPFLWGFELRERLMELYERSSGARMHSIFIRPGGLSKYISMQFLQDVLLFLENLYLRIDEIEDLLTKNRIWKIRLKNVGNIVYEAVHKMGFTGVMSRGTGFLWDLRRSNFNDENYEWFSDWAIIKGINGDCYDRYLVRINEIRQSSSLIQNLIKEILKLKNWIFKYENKIWIKRMKLKRDMESLIHHFKLITEGFLLEKEDGYKSIEAPKGEFGVSIISDGNYSAVRCHLKGPGFLHLQGLDFMSQNIFLADLVAIIGTQDLVLGEIDR